MAFGYETYKLNLKNWNYKYNSVTTVRMPGLTFCLVLDL
jgi:hypothetical protein